MLALERLFRSLRRTLKRSYPNTSLTKKITQSAGLYEFLLIRSYRDGYSALHIFSTALSGARKNCLFETPRLKITSLFLPFRRTLKRSHPDTSLTKKITQSDGLCCFFGGRRWIRTIEARRNRFTVCPLWPLGNPPKKWSW